MPFPQNQDLKDALICVLYQDKNPNYKLKVADVYEKLGDIFELTDEERNILYSEYTNSSEDRSYWQTRTRAVRK